jgi:hypothetical protein
MRVAKHCHGDLRYLEHGGLPMQYWTKLKSTGMEKTITIWHVKYWCKTRSELHHIDTDGRRYSHLSTRLCTQMLLHALKYTCIVCSLLHQTETRTTMRISKHAQHDAADEFSHLPGTPKVCLNPYQTDKTSYLSVPRGLLTIHQTPPKTLSSKTIKYTPCLGF